MLGPTWSGPAIGSVTMQDQIVAVVAGVLALVALVLAVVLVRGRSRTERQLAQAREETAALRDQLALIERRLARPAVTTETSYVITGLREDGDAEPAGPVATVEPALFADLVLRETVVKAASLAHGVRRALDPETRNRIRFEMRREVKRARKQRRADVREARRDGEVRRRAADGAGDTGNAEDAA